MKRRSVLRTIFSGLAAAALGLAACSDSGAPTAPSGSSKFLGLGGSPSSSLIECSSSETQSATSVIGLLGGTISVGGTSVVFPEGVLDNSTVELTVPASKYVEINVTVDGQPHFLFSAPVVVTIDYSRCTRNDLFSKTLSVWNIDPDSKALLEDMGGLDDKLTQTITFTTDHFSGYAIAD